MYVHHNQTHVSYIFPFCFCPQRRGRTVPRPDVRFSFLRAARRIQCWSRVMRRRASVALCPAAVCAAPPGAWGKCASQATSTSWCPKARASPESAVTCTSANQVRLSSEGTLGTLNQVFSNKVIYQCCSSIHLICKWCELTKICVATSLMKTYEYECKL